MSSTPDAAKPSPTCAAKLDSVPPRPQDIMPLLCNGANELVLLLANVAPSLADMPSVSIAFVFRWRDGAQGTSGRLHLFVNGVRVTNRMVSRYGDTTFVVLINKPKDRNSVQAVLEIDSIGQTMAVNRSDFDFRLAELEVRTATPVMNPIGRRDVIAGYAKAAADRLGLRGLYMNESRRIPFQAAIEQALRLKTPYSVVRLGDGEGRVLGYPLYFSQHEILTQVLYYQFGPNSMHEMRGHYGRDWVDAAMADLSRLVTAGVDNSDVVGLPVYDYFRTIEDVVTAGHVGYGCAMHSALARFPYIDPARAVGTNVFQQLAERSDFFPQIAKCATGVWTVGPWDLSAELAPALGVAKVTHIEVPRHFTWNEEKGAGQFPLLYKIVEQRLRAVGNLQGQLFLVGAGLMGKWYCAVIKEHGGVALDIGSVFDSWAKKGLPYAVMNSARIQINALDPNKA